MATSMDQAELDVRVKAFLLLKRSFASAKRKRYARGERRDARGYDGVVYVCEHRAE